MAKDKTEKGVYVTGSRTVEGSDIGAQKWAQHVQSVIEGEGMTLREPKLEEVKRTYAEDAAIDQKDLEPMVALSVIQFLLRELVEKDKYALKQERSGMKVLKSHAALRERVARLYVELEKLKGHEIERNPEPTDTSDWTYAEGYSCGYYLVVDPSRIDFIQQFSDRTPVKGDILFVTSMCGSQNINHFTICEQYDLMTGERIKPGGE